MACLRDRLGRCHLHIQLKKLLQPLGIILEPPTDVDALQGFVVGFVGGAQILGYGIGVVEVDIAEIGFQLAAYGGDPDDIRRLATTSN